MAAVFSEAASSPLIGSAGTPVSWGSLSGMAAPRPAAAQHDHKAVFFHRLDEDFHAGDLDLAQDLYPFGAFRGRDATGAAVGYDAFFVYRAEIGADGDIALLKGEIDAQRLQCAAPDDEFQGVVTK